LSDRAREIAILLVAHHRGSTFEVSAHEAVARRIGFTDADLAQRRAPGSADDDERAVAEMVNRLLHEADLDDAAYATACQSLSEELIFEVNAVVGYCSQLALQLKIFGC
jgi:4-carboxymuconolactone decarboxylase